MTPQQQGLRAAHVVALVGALVTIASLWRPWYAIDVPQSLRDALASEGARASGAGSMLGAFVQQMAAALPSRIEADGWQALRGADVALTVCAATAGALVLAAAGAAGSAIRVDRSAAGRWIAVAGLVALAVAGEHLLHRPGGGFGVTVALGDGAWLAAAGTAAMAVGGALAAGAGPDRAPAPTWSAPTAVPPVSEDRALTSVAPPGAQ